MSKKLCTYTARFEHDHGYSVATIEAASPEEALEKAFECGRDDCEFIDTFDADTGDVKHIDIEAEDGTSLSWTDPNLIARWEGPQLLHALKAAFSAIEEVSDLMHYEDGQPVTYLESWQIAHAFAELVSVLVQADEAIRAADPEFKPATTVLAEVEAANV